jgi:release factor glutamine methyltransferase
VTLREALLQGVERLERHRVSSPRLNAEVLLGHCLSVDRTYLYTHDERVLSPDECDAFESALYDRISGVPVQYIVGRQEFYGRYFVVTPAVLIPRPETEYIVEAVLERKPAAEATIIDVGAGSGCIGVTLALELPQTRVTIADVSLDALRVAKANAERLGARVGIVCMDVVDAVSNQFDFVVSNPPYVSPSDTSRLQREVREHEPHVALFAADDGLSVIRRLIPAAACMLRLGGHLIMEIGFGMEERVLGLFGPEWEKLPTKADLQGIPRTIIAQRIQ